LLNRYPWLPAALTVAYVFFTILVVAVIVYFPYIGDRAPRFFQFVSIVLILGPLVLTILQIMNLRRTITSIPRLALLYLEIILMFAVVYFCAVSDPSSAETKTGHPLIKGVDTAWVVMVADGSPNKPETLRKALLCFQDCIYFSLVTSTTVGYGDMVPTAPVTKTLVGIQVLVSFFLIAFGAGYFFASKTGTKERATIEKIERNLEDIKKRLDDLAEEKPDGDKADSPPEQP
jgi:ABC-type transport system involved in multi-copper enzyme maturation permease subunit